MKLYIDISNYILTRSNTGIQRVVREFLTRLLDNKQKFDYEILSYNEKESCFDILQHNELKQFLLNVKAYRFKKSAIMALGTFEKGSYFLDMDAIWHDSLKRDFFYPQLKKQEVFIFNFLYDLAPIVVPQFTHEQSLKKFTAYLDALFAYSDFVFFDSRSAEEDFLHTKKTLQIKREIPTRVIKLGSDISPSVHSAGRKAGIPTGQLPDKKYILFVGTLEPRKNQAFMLDVFESLAEKYDDLSLVFVGRLGWNSNELAERIQSHYLLNRQLYWLDNVDDGALNLLYKSAFLVAYLSEHEGFGLPIAESLKYGNITIASKNSSMYEVGKNYADYIQYHSINELYEVISLYLQNAELYHKKRAFIKAFYQPYTWDMTYRSIVDVFNNLEYSNQIMTNQLPKSLQFVFISIDVKNLTGTIKALDQYVPFAKEYIVVTRASLIEKIQAIPTQRRLIVIDEEEILGDYTEGFSKRDHQSKNWLLRASLLQLDMLDNEFIMLDDDNRPLKNIDLNFYINEKRQYCAYYFYNLLHWHEFTSEYDEGQHTTRELLDGSGLELLSYSSHMPQIINKQIWSEVVENYFDIGLRQPLDEWSVYFNYAVSKYPLLFSKKIFETMNWPANPDCWDFEYAPADYTFENYYAAAQFGKGDLSLKDKIKIKEKESAPYAETKSLMREAQKYLGQTNSVHGQMQFKKESFYCVLSNIPYFIMGKKGAIVRLPVNFKILNNVDAQDVFFYYTIDGDVGHRVKLPQGKLVNNYTENIINIPIRCPYDAISKKSYSLLFDLEVGGQSIYADSSPYLVKLLAV